MVLDMKLNETQRDFVIKQDYYRTDQQLAEDVTKLMEWMSKQPHLPEITDKKWLSHFLIGCKYNLHRAKRTIDSYFVSRAEYPEFICSFDREQLLNESKKSGSICVFPKLTSEACRVMCTRLVPTSKDTKLDFLLYFQVMLGNLDLQMKEEPMRGEIMLLDLEHLSLSQFMSMPPSLIKNALNLCINSFPVSIKGIHYVNSPSYIGQMISFFKMFLPNKIQKRIFVHDTLESLHQFIPKDVLPAQYGGTAGDYDDILKDWLEYGMANNEWLKNRPKADLSKWVGQPKIGELGVEGTFKKLEID
ncbi:Cellular retinaldehyde binding/alpha-tocopherol transport,CRAL/TRIO, N-terminal domain,CRAL-TRIO lipid [Cinara cedri]|uniref:Cellular retinaldehyde binding/alpha-tocopherol transport,CRAL/TRIO, N-terminal domain,CRAL-TRIO lipid n=1 Tax=Cinara cedri TaxID=506608 RepID=A0A5E4N7K5_9HEMI|nr:Cellular retinaldehyde binding/alpha-tocopherol transport,CRAL/TRIO, N-terminal domain,CRAL-TRIO lipid [Cinara cedri]